MKKVNAPVSTAIFVLTDTHDFIENQFTLTLSEPIIYSLKS
jgi:hypothetical protein